MLRHGFIAIALIVTAAASATASDLLPDEPLVITPGAERDAALPPPGVWPSYSGSVGGDKVRNCLTWGQHGWEEFVDRYAIHAMRKVGRVWIHNPGGMLLGKPMRLDQFTRCRQAAELTGNEVLERVAHWDEFTRAMSRLSAEGDLVIYVGAPHTLPLADDETDQEWLTKALEELRPVLDIEPPVTIGLDATYGRPASELEPHRRWGRRGGPDGLNARLVRELLDRGHEVLFEPGVLAGADWAHGRVGAIAAHRHWHNKMLKGRDARPPHYLKPFGRYLKPSEVTQRQFRYLQMLKDRTPEEERELINALVAAGYDVIVPTHKHPERPYKE